MIVIAHDEKLEEYFLEAKEKIFGQTIRVKPHVEAAFGAFHAEVAEGVEKKFVAKYRGEIVGTFSESGVQSLRILRHLIEDLARLAETLTHTHREHDEAMRELVHLFSALDIEWRFHRLKASDLRERSVAVYAYSGNKAEGDTPRIVIAKNRYKSVSLTSTLLQDDVLTDMLAEGRFEPVSIRASLDVSPHFLKPQSAPPWRIVMSFDTLDDTIVGTGLDRMREQFDNREVLDSGEMLHIFALRMMLASRGILGRSVDAASRECKAYVDDLLCKGRLPARGPDWNWDRELERAAYGHGYWVTDEYKSEFKEVYQHLTSAREKALEAEFPKLAPELLKIVETDGQHFLEQICHTAKGNNPYAAIPILAAIEPKDFVAAWMRSPKPSWHWIPDALKERHQRTRADETLGAELPWIKFRRRAPA